MSDTPALKALVDSYRPVTPISIIAVGAAMPAIASIAVSLRAYVKLKRGTSFGADDWLIIFSLVLCIGLGVTMIVGSAVHVLAQPTPLGDGPTGFLYVTDDKITTTFKIKYAFNIVQALAFGTIKLSVLFFYRRIFRGKWFNINSWAMIILVIIWTISFTFAYIFQCKTNFFALWTNLFDLLQYCFDDILFQRVLAISDVVTDIVILAIPIPCVWALHMSLQKRVAISSIFLLGALVIAFGVIRLQIIWQKLGDGFSSSQGILLMSTWFYWTIIEMSMAIFAACLPTVKPLFSDTTTAQSLSRVIQSLLSMRSLSSSLPNHDGVSSSSQTKFVAPTNSHMDNSANSFEMRDLGLRPETAPGRITVQRGFTQHYSNSAHQG